ncbi:MAG: glycosyltransferase [Paramuribaculum sp.]|nr:glycosyltransferase [Paramuribaculum sp.]
MTSPKSRNILFYSENFCGEQSRGGLEQATFRIAKALKETGQWEVFNAFRSKREGDEKAFYSNLIELSRSDSKFEKELENFIRSNRIDVVVNMSRFFRHKFIVRAAKKVNPDIKVLFMQHFAPGSEKKKPTYASGWHLLKLNPLNPLYWLRTTVYPLIKLPRNLIWKKIYRDVYDESDKVILLSEGYIESYKDIAGIQEDNKFTAIPNIFDLENEKVAEYSGVKEKRVLILSRMDEIQKRISLALKVWKKVMENDDLTDWHLDIVGSGHDISLEKRLAKRLDLKNYTFHGWKNREPFMRRTPIMMMTSEYEGLPLSVLEAQAYGCVPIAFDSFKSIHDVVTDDETGILIENFGDIVTFANKLIDLMKNKDKRLELAEQGIKEVTRFSSKIIVDRWQQMLNSL